ncbi:MAG: SpoIIIAC/SpoIIIAD family protein [Candidatus Limivicinus sp.]|jgi:stage III sporulation protein AD
MELICKGAALALASAIIGLVIKKSNPELSVLLNFCTICFIVTAALGFAGNLNELISTVKKLADVPNLYILPVLKCVAIAIISKFTAELCRDASQSAAAAAVEFAGTVCAMGISIPLIISVLKMLGEIV